MEKIKASDFRIGNLYNQYGNVTKVTWNTLQELEKAPEGQLWFKPIPLTEKMILDFGGKHGYKNTFISIGNKITVDLEDKSFNIYTCDEYPDVTLKLPEFVHLFQNLIYHLIGEELTLKSQ